MELFLSTMSHIFLLLGHMQIFFLIMSRFWISVGGFLAFFAYVPPFNTATKSLSDDTYLFINIPCI